jgi:hypothetical protein
MKVRIYRCDPRVRGYGHWVGDEYMTWRVFARDYPEHVMGTPERDLFLSIKTPLHPRVADQKFDADPRFHWETREEYINE